MQKSQEKPTSAAERKTASKAKTAEKATKSTKKVAKPTNASKPEEAKEKKLKIVKSTATKTAKVEATKAQPKTAKVEATKAQPKTATTTATKTKAAKERTKATTRAKKEGGKTQAKPKKRVQLKIRDYAEAKQRIEAGEQVQAKQEDKNLNIGNIIINTFLFTMVALLGLAMWFVSIVYVIEPKASAKYFDFLSAPRASLSAYERAYDKSHENYDLYDVINKSIEVGSYKTTIKYINELRTQTYYEAFMDEIDALSTEGVAKRYIALVGDYDGYLNSQYVIALYKSGDKDSAIKAAAEDLDNANYRSFALSAFFDCLYNDKSLNTYIADILAVRSYTCKDGNTLLENLERRRKTVDITNAEDIDNLNERLVRLYTSMKIDNVLYDIYKYSGENDLADDVAAEYRALRDIYDALVK